jgi:hypothetical protein
MEAPRFDWSTAKVSDGELSVKLVGDAPRGWKASFNATVALLGGRDLGTVELRKRTARVDGVSPGDEERVRHLLESAIQQANAAHQVDDAPEDAPEDDAPEETPEDRTDDDEMTERFRSFASD